MKNSLYFWENSWYDKQAGLWPDAITMPAAQLREKPGGDFHWPFTWLQGNILKGGNYNDSEGKED